MWSLRSPWPDPCSWSQDEALTPVSSLRCHRCRLDALVPVDHQTPDGSASFRPQTQLYSMRRREGSRPAKTMIPCTWADVPEAEALLDERRRGADVMPFRGSSAQDHLGRRHRTTLGQEGTLSRDLATTAGGGRNRSMRENPTKNVAK